MLGLSSGPACGSEGLATNRTCSDKALQLQPIVQAAPRVFLLWYHLLLLSRVILSWKKPHQAVFINKNGIIIPSWEESLALPGSLR